MIRSMTGYARAEAQGPWGRLSWELRSVNHRYLDISLRMPDELRAIENEVRQLAGARLSRGKVEAGLRYTRENAEAAAIALDLERLKQLRQALDAVGRGFGAAASPDPMRLLAWPGVVKAESSDFAPVQVAALKLFENALKDFTETRAREGEKITQHLQERCTAIEQHVSAVRARLPLVRTQRRKNCASAAWTWASPWMQHGWNRRWCWRRNGWTWMKNCHACRRI